MKNLIAENRFEVLLKYFMTKEPKRDDADSYFYGVCVEKQIGEEVVESESALLTEDSEEIPRVIEKLREYQITPFTLLETLDDHYRCFAQPS